MLVRVCTWHIICYFLLWQRYVDMLPCHFVCNRAGDINFALCSDEWFLLSKFWNSRPTKYSMAPWTKDKLRQKHTSLHGVLAELRGKQGADFAPMAGSTFSIVSWWRQLCGEVLLRILLVSVHKYAFMLGPVHSDLGWWMRTQRLSSWGGEKTKVPNSRIIRATKRSKVGHDSLSQNFQTHIKLAHWLCDEGSSWTMFLYLPWWK
jgi:hypothetical protein